MKHAALIMAHKNKRQLIRLIRAVSTDNIDVFVHLDKKWKLSKDEISEIERSADNVFVIKKRIHGVLDTFSLPQIELNLIDAAIRREKETCASYGYFILLSGQDYPIKSKAYIQEFLDSQYPKPLIDHEIAAVGNWTWGKYQLTKWNNKIEDIQKRRKKGLIRTIQVGRCVLSYKIEKLFRGLPWDKLQKSGFKIYGGSQWWILPHDVIDFIRLQLKSNKKVVKELKRAWTPEENFFQTIAMNSPFATRIDDDDEIFDKGKGEFKAMTYCNFFTPTKSFRGHPHTITVDDYDRIMAKKALFARKFDDTEDEKVLDMIDENIAERKDASDLIISVIVPAHNSAKTVGRAIESVYRQGVDNWKIILVNDGSSDETATICDEYAAKDDRIKAIHLEPNQGVSHARNVGLENVKDDGYVCFLDSDDEIRDNSFSYFLSQAETPESDIVIGGFIKVKVLNCEKTDCVTNKEYCGEYTGDKIRKFFIEDEFTNGGSPIRKHLCGCLYRVGFLCKNNLRFCDEQKFGEDARFMIESYCVAKKILVTEIASYIYYENLDTVSDKYYEKYRYSTVAAYKYSRKMMKKLRLDKRFYCHLIGGTFVGITVFVECSCNRKVRKSKIFSFIYSPTVFKVLLSVIFMRKKNMRYGDLSRQDKLAAVCYLLGLNKKGVKIVEEASK